MKNIFKIIRNYSEFLLFLIINFILKLFSFSFTSNLGGFIVRNVGVYTKYFKIIISNLSILGLPEEKIITLAKKNLDQTGRVFFEFFNLKKFNWTNIKVINQHFLDDLKKHHGSCIFLSAHLGNWEITRNYLLQNGFILHSVYRHANNNLIDKYIQNNRKQDNAFFYRKGSESAKNMIMALKNNHHLALLVDQRDSSGPIINFMGKDCFATDGYANLALKYKTKICPIYSKRINSDTFEIVVEKPLEYKEFSNLESKTIVERIHESYFKKWILEDPTQWLWVHQRWRK